MGGDETVEMPEIRSNVSVIILTSLADVTGITGIERLGSIRDIRIVTEKTLLSSRIYP